MAGAECAVGGGCDDDGIVYSWKSLSGQYLLGCTSDGCVDHGGRTAAEMACLAMLDDACGGIVQTATGAWQTRAGSEPLPSPSSEDAWLKEISPASCEFCGGSDWICCQSIGTFQELYFDDHPCTGASYFSTEPSHTCTQNSFNARTEWYQSRFGARDDLLNPVFQFRADQIVRNQTSGSVVEWPAAIGDGLSFKPAQPVSDTGNNGAQVNYGAAASLPQYSSSYGDAPPGLMFTDQATDMAMYANATVAVGGYNTFFAAVTPSRADALEFGTLLGFRSENAFGAFAWAMGTHGCMVRG